jgi:HD superfamily phosphohydrolase
MIACLLHDIGHGPFSHAFEGIFQEKMIRHERWTPYFLKDYGTSEFFHDYNKLNPRHTLTEEKFQQIADMIMHKPIEKRVLADIVSSQLDADRLDYLLRDSHFCGVQYGEFDFRWMLHCLAIVNAEEGERLGITHKGIGVVEHYLMARRLMTRNIYHSQKKLAIEQYLVELLANLAKDLEHYVSFEAIKKTRLGEFLMAANVFNQQVQSTPNKRTQLRDTFLKTEYAAYKELCDYDVFAVIRQLSMLEDAHPSVQLAKRVQHRVMPMMMALDHTQSKIIEEELHDFKIKHHHLYQDWQLQLIETPHQAYSGEADPILVLSRQGGNRPIGEYSFMIDALSDRLEHIAFLAIDKGIANDKPVQTLIGHLQALMI